MQRHLPVSHHDTGSLVSSQCHQVEPKWKTGTDVEAIPQFGICWRGREIFCRATPRSYFCFILYYFAGIAPLVLYKQVFSLVATTRLFNRWNHSQRDFLFHTDFTFWGRIVSKSWRCSCQCFKSQHISQFLQGNTRSSWSGTDDNVQIPRNTLFTWAATNDCFFNEWISHDNFLYFYCPFNVKYSQDSDSKMNNSRGFLQVLARQRYHCCYYLYYQKFVSI